MKVLVILPGRFQPFHLGHKSVYDVLVRQFGVDDVYIATSNKVDPPRSPFNFAEKQQIIAATGIDPSRVVQTRDPYKAQEITSQYDPEDTKLLFAVSAKDMADDPRFESWTKRDGTPAYFQPAPNKVSEMENFDQHGYIFVVPTLDFKVDGKPMRSATEFRREFAAADAATKAKMTKDILGTDNPQLVNLLASKITEGKKMKINNIVDENFSGAFASVVAPLGAKVQKRSKVKEIITPITGTSNTANSTSKTDATAMNTLSQAAKTATGGTAQTSTLGTAINKLAAGSKGAQLSAQERDAISGIAKGIAGADSAEAAKIKNLMKSITAENVVGAVVGHEIEKFLDEPFPNEKTSEDKLVNKPKDKKPTPADVLDHVNRAKEYTKQKPVSESKMAELDMDLDDPELSDREFEKIYGMSRREAREEFSQTNKWDFPDVRDPNKKLHEQGVAEGLNEFAQGDFNGRDDNNDLQLYLNVAKKLNMKKYKPSTAHNLIAKKMAELVDAVDDEKVDWARHMARKAQGLPSMLDQQGVAEGGPFSYGKPPRKGSVADLAAQKRKEQDRKAPPIEPRDQMVGNAKVTKDVKEGGEQRVTVYGNHHGYYAWTPNSGVLAFTSGSNGPIKIQAYWNDLKGDSPGIQRYVSNYMKQVQFSELPNKAQQIISKHLLRQDIAEEWSQKYKNSINCSHPKGFSQKAHCAGKRKHNESMEMEMTCPDCGMCETHGDNMMEVKQRLDAHCWKGKHKEGTKIKGGIRVNNCVPNESIQESEKRCMQCGMTNCICPPGKCKCKPIAGWIPGKGFKKDLEEATNDYFKRRKDEEDRIAGIKPPAKRTPQQTDYQRRRNKEQQVGEAKQKPSAQERLNQRLKTKHGIDLDAMERKWSERTAKIKDDIAALKKQEQKANEDYYRG